MGFDVNDISSVLRERLKVSREVALEEVGYVAQIGDGVAQVYGLAGIKPDEIVVFDTPEQQRGLALNLEEDIVGVIILGDMSGIEEGTMVSRTHKKASINVGEGLLGRVIDTLGNPIDGKGTILGDLYEMPLERKAPGVLYRQPVSEPLQTGIKAIDAMIPIGCGQRELIIGDKQTGKTSIAIDTIINQRSFYEAGDPVYCIYVAVGQKASTVAKIVEILMQRGALEYTVVVAAPAFVPASLQCYAPFAGAAIGEFFRDTGKRALVVYDDLSKQAVAYREVSLLLQRSPGREAYPGDVFYLHSRLLERAAKINSNDDIAAAMNDIPDSIRSLVRGGGSLTALPIIETQDGNVSAYIPTNVISITDGQILLDKNLFNSGFKPAVNVGLSVSRVGSSAQLLGMKKVAGTLKISQSLYAEMAAFSQFGSDVDANTAAVLKQGEINNELLKQHNNTPMPVAEQIIVIYASINGYFINVERNKIKKEAEGLLKEISHNYGHLLDKLAKGQWNKVIEDELSSILQEYFRQS